MSAGRIGIAVVSTSSKAPPPGDHHWPPDLPSRITRPWDTRPIKRFRAEAAPGRPRVLYIGFSDTRGGAAIAASRLTSRLVRNGEIEALEIVARQFGDNPRTVSLDRAHRFILWLNLRKAIAARNVLASDPYGWMPFEAAFVNRVAEVWQPDMIHLHNLHGGWGTIPLTALARLASRAPIVWTLHDMWAATGHCAYSMDCEGWRRGCGDCPDLKLYPSLIADRTRAIAKEKRRIYAEARPVMVSPSRWLCDVVKEARATAVLDARVIPNGVDLNVFCPASRDETRARLGIEPGRPVLMFAAETLDGDTRKGAPHLRTALERVQAGRKGARLNIVLMGGSGDGLLEGIEGLEVHRAGFVSDPDEASGLYAAADLFVCPSLQDNLPNTLVEASACGTASVAFDVGGCGEIIENGVTGAVAPAGDANALGDAIAAVIDDPARLSEMGRAARQRAQALYSDARMAGDYLALYRQLIEESHGR